MELILKELKKYGILGIILMYFIWQDNESRREDREVRKDTIKAMKVLSAKVMDNDKRISILEYVVEKHEVAIIKGGTDE